MTGTWYSPISRLDALSARPWFVRRGRHAHLLPPAGRRIHDHVSALPQAAKINSDQDYVIWGQLFRDADEPRGEPIDEVTVDLGPIRLPASLPIADLKLLAGPWQITAVELLEDSVNVTLVHHHQIGPRRHIQPRLTLSDDIGTEYRPSGGRSFGSPETTTWQVRLKPATPPDARVALLTVDGHRLRMAYSHDT